MVGRPPESLIAPDYLLDLRARVRRRHTLVDSAVSGSSASKPCSTTTGFRSEMGC
jgi:hypothetical protein